MKLRYVPTNYNSSSDTRAAIASVFAGSRAGDVRIVVVDNKSRHENVRLFLFSPKH